MENLVKEAIKTLLFEVVDFPMSYYSEKALQVRLASLLMKEPELYKPVESGLADLVLLSDHKKGLSDKENLVKEAFSVTPLQMEYRVNDKDNYKYDICILPKEEIQKIKNHNFKTDEGYIVPEIGIEIGTEKIGWKSIVEHNAKDMYKLNKTDSGGRMMKGFIITIIRTYKEGFTESRFLNLINSLKKFSETVISNTKFLCLVIRTMEVKVYFINNHNELNEYNLISLKDKESLKKAIAEKLHI